MANSIPGVERVTRLMESEKIVVKYGDNVFTESKVLIADSNFFEFFSFKLREGNIRAALKEPHSIVLTTATALKYFGDHPAIGKIISVGNEAFTVTGITDIPPSNSHIQYDLLLSAASEKIMSSNEWGNLEVFTYFLKNPATELSSIESKLKDIVRKNIAPTIEKYVGESFDAFEKKGGIYAFFSYPLSSSHLHHQEVLGTLTPSGDIKNVYIIGIVGMFILVIACINL